jgi:hypothetical protein
LGSRPGAWVALPRRRRRLASEAVVTEVGPHPPAELEPSPPSVSIVVLAGHATHVPQAAVTSGMQRTVTVTQRRPLGRAHAADLVGRSAKLHGMQGVAQDWPSLATQRRKRKRHARVPRWRASQEWHGCRSSQSLATPRFCSQRGMRREGKKGLTVGSSRSKCQTAKCGSTAEVRDGTTSWIYRSS